jgi:hypothetical protein
MQLAFLAFGSRWWAREPRYALFQSCAVLERSAPENYTQKIANTLLPFVLSLLALSLSNGRRAGKKARRGDAE